ncbi:hypothetical protein ACQR16_10200 [Bradyrhizobium oligotrophicum]|uniref:hypothetical protein n=1 Tax=Bradyrhizobium oligotrophicum TaxID=44255 RepID=UPI003EBF8137
MLNRQVFETSSTLEYRLTQKACSLRSEAEQMPIGDGRAELLRKADQMDVAVQINQWLTSPGLRAPT